MRHETIPAKPAKLIFSFRNNHPPNRANIGALLPNITVRAASDKLRLVNHPSIAPVVNNDAKINFFSLLRTLKETFLIRIDNPIQIMKVFIALINTKGRTA